MFAYIAENGMPEDYQMVDWGFPTYEAVLPNFTGGTLNEPELNLTNDFAKAWLKHNVFMKGEKVGVQFDFVE
jgi:hypothetical protein